MEKTHPRFCLQGREQEVITAYQNGESTPEVGRRFGVSHASIIQLLRKFNVPRRTRSEANIQTHCKRGHVLVAGNLYFMKGGTRSCLTCRQTAGRRSRFGLEIEQYEQKRRAQNNLCAICQVPLTRPQVDHDHSCCPAKTKTCGKCVRDLLCRSCNLAVGNVKEDFAIAERLLAYLRKWKV